LFPEAKRPPIGDTRITARQKIRDDRIKINNSQETKSVAKTVSAKGNVESRLPRTPADVGGRKPIMAILYSLHTVTSKASLNAD